MTRGLTSAEAAKRLAADGPNALPVAERKGLRAIALGVVREPMFLLLVAAAGVYLLVGDIREALVLAASILVVIAITIVQERKAERALDALRDLSSPRALVIRDGERMRIAGADVVMDDVLIVAEGDRIPADANTPARRSRLQPMRVLPPMAAHWPVRRSLRWTMPRSLAQCGP